MPDLSWIPAALEKVWEFVVFLSSPEYVSPLTWKSYFLPLLIGLPFGLIVDTFVRHIAGKPWKGWRAYFTTDKGETAKSVLTALMAFVLLGKFVPMNIPLAMLIGAFTDNALVLLTLLWRLALSLIPKGLQP